MRFEYGPAKSAANKAKHGIDFEAAQALWADPMLLEAPARTDGGPRFIVIGRIGERHWFARRGENTRLISVRRARREEVEHYEDD